MPLMGRYEIQQELGRGAMAVVYKARDPELGRNVALKVLHLERCANADVRRRFLREARAAGKLTHGNVVTIFDVGEHEDRPYIAMELLDGRFLNDQIKSDERLTWQQVAEIAQQLSGALSVAHAAGIVHRDIKPANIVWLPRENQAKLTDFGIARVDDATQSEATQVGHVIGTPQYMSPEQITGRAVDARSDLFSLGVVLYQLLSGQRPFSGDNFATLTYQIAHTKPAPLAELAKDVPVELIRIIDRLLAKEPDQRYQSATELLDALRGMRVGASPQPVAATRRKWWMRALPEVAIVVTLGIVLWWVMQQSKPPPEVATVQPTTTADAVSAQEKELNLLLSGFTCANLQARLNGERSLTVRGPMREEDFSRLMDTLEQLKRFDNIGYEVDAMPWPFCEAAAIVTRSATNSDAQITLDTAATFTAGVPLTYAVHAPNGAAYVYVDLYRTDGSVVRLQSGKITTAKPWPVQPPFGDALLVVMATSQPLQTEAVPKAQNYLATLHRVLQGETRLVASTYRTISLSP